VPGPVPEPNNLVQIIAYKHGIDRGSCRLRPSLRPTQDSGFHLQRISGSRQDRLPIVTMPAAGPWTGFDWTSGGREMKPSGKNAPLSASTGTGKLRWPRLFGQNFRFDKWNVCRG
jgi:hypothetical protein